MLKCVVIICNILINVNNNSIKLHFFIAQRSTNNVHITQQNFTSNWVCYNSRSKISPMMSEARFDKLPNPHLLHRPFGLCKWAVAAWSLFVWQKLCDVYASAEGWLRLRTEPNQNRPFIWSAAAEHQIILMGSKDRWPSLRLFITSILVGCGGSFHLGYQLTITNPSQDVFLAFVQESFESHFGAKLSKNTLEVTIKVHLPNQPIFRHSGPS
jgi:hypothetical protein